MKSTITSSPRNIAATSLAAIAMAAGSLLPTPGAANSAVLETIRNQNARVQRLDLPNGMTCLIKRDTSAPVASIQFWVGTGSIHEEEFLGSGLSHAVEHMIFNGTETRSANDITHEINQAGGRINAYTTLDRTVFYTEIPAAEWKVGFDALADSLMNATFPEPQWEQERNVILREFAMGYDDPNRVLNKLLWRTVYRKHPYRIPTIGYEPVFSARSREDLATFFSRNYVPDNMLLVIVGNIEPAEIDAHARKTFSSFTRKARAPVVIPAEPTQLAPREARVTGAYQVSRLSWCYRTVPLTHPDAAALDVLAAVAGQGRSSRLVQRIKEQAQRCTDISTWSYTPLHDGLFGISATYPPEHEAALREAIQAQVESLTEEPFSAAEVAKARRQLLMGELNDLQTMQGQASSIASGHFFTGDYRFGERYLEQLESITPDELKRVARLYLKDTTRTIALLTPETNASEATTSVTVTQETPHGDMTTLPNGVRVVVRTDPRLPMTSACLALLGGLRSESAEAGGITALLADLLTRGTPTRDSASFAATVESLGASISPFSGRNSLGLRIHGLSSDMPTLLELAADALQGATFPEDEVEKQRGVQLAALKRSLESPMYHAQRQLAEMIHAGHPYARERLGTEESLQSITRQDLQAHLEKILQSHHLVISFAGNISQDEAVSLATKHFGMLEPKDAPPDALAPATPELPATRTKTLPRQQAIVIAGFPGVAIDDPRADALSILEKSMSGLASTLGESVRGEHALAYFVGAFSSLGIDPGLYGMYAGTQAENTDKLIDLFEQEATRVREDGLDAREIERATRQLIAAHDMSLQDSGSVAMKSALNELYGLGFDYDDSLPQRLRSVTPEQLKEAAALLAPESMVLSIVLPEDTADSEE